MPGRATRFVADFVGGSNVLPPELTGAARRPARLGEPAPRACADRRRRGCAATSTGVRYLGAATRGDRRRSTAPRSPRCCRAPGRRQRARRSGWPGTRARCTSWRTRDGRLRGTARTRQHRRQRRAERRAARAGSRTCSGAGRALLLVLLLVPPLLWLGVIYVGSLFALLAQSFFSIDHFTGLIRYEPTLATYAELLRPVERRHHRAHRDDGRGGDAGGGGHLVPDRLLRRALCPRAVEGAVLHRRADAALVELSGQGLCVEADPGQGGHPRLGARPAGADAGCSTPCWRSR